MQKIALKTFYHYRPTLAKQFFFFLFIPLFFSSCITRKLDKWVAKHYNNAQQAVPNKRTDNNYVSVDSKLAYNGNGYSHTERITNSTLPLLFYWTWDYRNNCTINPKMPVDNFTASLLSYAGKKGLKQKLNGRTLELSIEEMPHAFDFDDKGWMVYVLLFYFGKETISIQPLKKDISVTYTIKQDGAVTKTGTILIPDAAKTVYIKMFNSTKKKVMSFLDQYDSNITAMAKVVIDKLIAEGQL